MAPRRPLLRETVIQRRDGCRLDAKCRRREGKRFGFILEVDFSNSLGAEGWGKREEVKHDPQVLGVRRMGVTY